MLKNIILPATTLFAATLFPLFTNADEQTDNLNHLLNKQQLADFCSNTGNKSFTRIKIPLPNKTHVYGSIICSVKPNPDLAAIAQ